MSLRKTRIKIECIMNETWKSRESERAHEDLKRRESEWNREILKRESGEP